MIPFEALRAVRERKLANVEPCAYHEALSMNECVKLAKKLKEM